MRLPHIQPLPRKINTDCQNSYTFQFVFSCKMHLLHIQPLPRKISTDCQKLLHLSVCVSMNNVATPHTATTTEDKYWLPETLTPFNLCFHAKCGYPTYSHYHERYVLIARNSYILQFVFSCKMRLPHIQPLPRKISTDCQKLLHLSVCVSIQNAATPRTATTTKDP